MRKRIMLTCAAALLAVALTACDDGEDAGATETTGDETAAGEETDGGEGAPSEDAGEGADAGAQPDDLPDEWPDELPVHGGVELGRVIVEDRDGSPYIQVQYRTDEDIEESAAWFESLEDHGWDVEVEEGSEGTNRFLDANLEGHGWSARASFENNLYTWTVQEQQPE